MFTGEDLDHSCPRWIPDVASYHASRSKEGLKMSTKTHKRPDWKDAVLLMSTSHGPNDQPKSGFASPAPEAPPTVDRLW